jgi:hypothetical protein
MTNEELPAVTYRSAFAWTCLDCGKTNYDEGVVSENPAHHDQHMEELREAHPGEDWDDAEGEWIHMPTVVTCGHCSKRFRVDHGNLN